MTNEHNLTISGSVVTGTTREVAVTLRREPFLFSMGKIADLLGQTRSNISRVLQGTPYSGRLKRPKRPALTAEVLRELRDEEIVEKYNIPLSNVVDRRRELGIRLPPKVNLERRQLLLCQIIFGEEYRPGEQFERIITILVNNLLTTELQRNLILDFYFKGASSTEAEKVYRHELRQQIKAYVSSAMQEGDLKKIWQHGGIVLA